MRALVIGSDVTLVRSLKESGAQVSASTSGEDGIEFARSGEYDIVLIDDTRLEQSGIKVLRTLRDVRCKTPVILLSKEQSIEAKVVALDRGADDYLTLPFHDRELRARVRAVVRRSKGHATSTITVGELSLCLEKREIRGSGTLITLKQREYEILELLALQRGSVVAYGHLFERLYADKKKPQEEILRTFICHVREKLDTAIVGGAAYIVTSYGIGYALRAPEQKQLLAA